MALLLAAGFDDGQQGFDKAAAGCALGAEREFAPDDCVTQRAFAAVVRRFQARDFPEQPQLVETVEQFIAQGNGRGVSTPLPVFQGVIDLRPTGGFDLLPHRVVANAPRAIEVPQMEHLRQRLHQAAADDRSIATRIDQSLEIPFEVRPTGLASIVERVVSCVPVGHDGAGERPAQQRERNRRGSRQPDCEALFFGRRKTGNVAATIVQIHAFAVPCLKGVSSQWTTSA